MTLLGTNDSKEVFVFGIFHVLCINIRQDPKKLFKHESFHSITHKKNTHTHNTYTRKLSWYIFWNYSIIM